MNIHIISIKSNQNLPRLNKLIGGRNRRSPEDFIFMHIREQLFRVIWSYLPLVCRTYILIDNEPFSMYSETEVDTEVDAVLNEVLFDYIPSDLVPLSHCRFVVDTQFCQSTLHVYNALGIRPLGFSGSMYMYLCVQCPGCGHVAKIK